MGYQRTGGFFFATLLALLLGMLHGLTVAAQQQELRALAGRFRNSSLAEVLKTATDMNRLKSADRTLVTRNMSEQFDCLMNTPSLRSFKGLEARLYGYVKAASAFQPRTTTRLEVMLYPFTKEHKTGKPVPVDEAPATLSILTNDLNQVLFNVDGFWDLCKAAGVPQFFEKFPVSDSTDDYIEIRIKDAPYRIIQLTGRPVFVPLTRKEFLEFLVARNRKIAADFEQAATTTRASLAQSRSELKKQLSPEMKKMHESIVQSCQQGLETLQKNTEGLRTKIRLFSDELATMRPEQAIAPAYINHEKTGGYYNQLAPAGRRDGQALYKVNPAYYGDTPVSSARLLMVTYWYHRGFCPDFVKEYVAGLFDQIDYRRLKENIQ